jgi:GNAT superfamily N-acetyltransferase
MTSLAQPLFSDHVEEAIDVFSEAFRGYPVMSFVAGPGGDTDARTRQLTAFFVRRRFLRGGPLFGVFSDGQLVGAAIVTLPDEPNASPAVSVLELDTWRALGEDARDRYESYARTTKPFGTTARHHHLNMIGVHPSHAGCGFARPLMDAVRRLAIADPDSAGVSLTTEVEKNVALYEHFGYDVVGHANVTPDLETWGMFLSMRGR